MQKLRAVFGKLGLLLAPAHRWLVTSPRAVFWLSAGGALLTALLFYLRSLNNSSHDAFPGQYDVMPVFNFVRDHWFLAMWLMLPALIVSLMRFKIKRPTLAVFIASLMVFVAWIAGEVAQSNESLLELQGVEVSFLTSMFRMILIGSLILSPPLLMWMYGRTALLDRYLLRQFLLPFTFCFVGFIAIWLIMDLADNGGDFGKAKASFADIAKFYIVQIPQIVVLITPVTLLLATLYSLGKMSKTNEIISMLSAGKSLARVLRPIFFVGIYASLVTLALNFEWAPEAEGMKDSIHENITSSKSGDIGVRNQFYRNRGEGRSWFVDTIPFNLSEQSIKNVQVREEDADGEMKTAYFARKARWYPDHVVFGKGAWRFIECIILHFDTPGQATPDPQPEDLYISGWDETPWKLSSGNITPEHLGVPALGFHIKTNQNQPANILSRYRTHWHARWAVPWNCFVIVLIAAPLGIVHSRRGALGGVAACILVFFASLFLGNFFLAVGQGNRMPAFLAAWATNFIFAAIGLYLLYSRSQNRDLPKLNPFRLLKRIGRSARKRSSSPSVPPRELKSHS